MALGAAYDAGITLYDTARSYGYGQAEGILGTFLRGRRDTVIVSTKFGILPAKPSGWKQKLKPAARAALRLFPNLRRSIQRQVRDQFTPGQFTLATLKSSVEASLRELKTEYVDILLMHAAPLSVLEQTDLLEALARLVESGKVRMAGISGDTLVIERYFELRPKSLATCQFTLNLFNFDFAKLTTRHSDLLLVGNQPFGGVTGVTTCRTALATLLKSHDLPQTLRRKLDLNDPELFPEVILNCALRGTGLAAVVASMMKEAHVRNNVRAIQECRFSLEELATLRQLLTEAMGDPCLPVAASGNR